MHTVPVFEKRLDAGTTKGIEIWPRMQRLFKNTTQSIWKKVSYRISVFVPASRLFPAKERKRGIERSLAEAFNNSNLRVKKKSKAFLSMFLPLALLLSFPAMSYILRSRFFGCHATLRFLWGGAALRDIPKKKGCEGNEAKS